MCTIDCDRVYCWPLLFKTRHRLHVLWPLFAHDSHKDTVGLLCYIIYFTTSFDYFHLLPFLFYSSTSSSTHVGLLCYLILWYRSGGSRYFHLLPVMFWSSSSSSDMFIIPWLVTYYKNSSTTYLQLFPSIYMSWSEDHFTFHLWPAFGIRKYQEFFEFSIFWPLIILK